MVSCIRLTIYGRRCRLVQNAEIMKSQIILCNFLNITQWSMRGEISTCSRIMSKNYPPSSRTESYIVAGIAYSRNNRSANEGKRRRNEGQEKKREIREKKKRPFPDIRLQSPMRNSISPYNDISFEINFRSGSERRIWKMSTRVFARVFIAYRTGRGHSNPPIDGRIYLSPRRRKERDTVARTCISRFVEKRDGGRRAWWERGEARGRPKRLPLYLILSRLPRSSRRVHIDEKWRRKWDSCGV